MNADHLVRVNDLKVTFRVGDRAVRAVDGVSFEMSPGRTLAIVGESGSGKTVTGNTLAGLTRHGNATISGQAQMDGVDMVSADETQRRRMRGRDIAMVFQDPMTSLNPFITVAEQISTAYRVHHPEVGRRAARVVAVDLLRRVGIPRPEARAASYPHQLSGGMRQRVVIAMAVANNPRMLIADEPTTALDVTVQAQILTLLRDLQQAHGTAILLITHDLGVVAEMADEVAVMYAGRIVEQRTVHELFAGASHPYTAALLAAARSLANRRGRLDGLEGQPATASDVAMGCAFAPRCPWSDATAGCTSVTPVLVPVRVGEGRVACHRADVAGNSSDWSAR